MTRLKRWLRRVAMAFSCLLLIVVAAFAGLQTPFGRGWLAGTVARMASTAGASIAVIDLEGVIPFDMRADRIEIADDRGVWLVIQHPRIDLSPVDLLSGRVTIGALTAQAIELARLPQASPTAATAPIPLSDRLHLPHLPVGIAVDRLAVERLALGPEVLGEPVEAALTGSATLTSEAGRIVLSLHRTDGQPGSIDLTFALAGMPPVLGIRLTADDPTGVVLGHLLNRDDRPALTLSLTGDGPLSQWRGRLTAAGGPLARAEFDLALAGSRDTVLTVTGIAAPAPLLPPAAARVVGEKVPIRLQATFVESGVVALDEMSVALAAGTVTGTASFGGLGRPVAARVELDLPDLSAVTGVAGQPAQGSAHLSATLSGSEERPSLRIDASGDAFRLGASGAKHAEAHMTVAASGDPGQPSPHIDVTGQGRIEGAIVPDSVILPAALGRDLDWSLIARGAPGAGTVEISRITAQGIGLDLIGSGRLGPGFQVRDGRLHLSVAELRPLAAAFGLPGEGTLILDAIQAGPGDNAAALEFNGSLARLRLGVPAIDGLTGGTVTILGVIAQKGRTTWVLDRLAISGAKAGLTGTGEFDPETGQLAATLSADVPSLQPLSAALGQDLAGHIGGRVAMAGTLDHPDITMQVEGDDLRAGRSRLDQLRLDARLSDLWAAKATIDGRFRRGELTGTLALEANASNPAELLIPRLRLQAADGSIDGNFKIDRATLLTRGMLAVRVPDLSRWSAIAGLPLAGSMALKAELERGSGQNIDLSGTADRVAFGPDAGRSGIGRLAMSWHLADAWGAPTGKAEVKLSALTLTAGRLDQATLSLASVRPGRFAFTTDAKGQFVEAVAFSGRGEWEGAPHGTGMDLRVTSFAGSIGSDRLQLTAPLALSRRGDEWSITNLALSLGSGQLSGAAALRGRALSGHVTAKSLPVGLVGRLAGYKDAGGTVALDATVAGTVAAPSGHFTLSGRGLSLSRPGQRIPSLGLDASGDWNGRELDLKGKVGGLKRETLAFNGSLPVVMTVAPFGLTLPPAGRLAMRLEGSGDLGNIAELLPIGEDHLTGHFTLDAAVTGTLGAPAASGHLTVADGRYESFATGAVLTKLKVDLAGDRDRFTLHDLQASDGAGGSLAARGSVILNGSAGPALELSAKLAAFRIAARDEAIVTASGTLAVAGTANAPKVTGALKVDRAECTIPDSLPPSVTRLKVVEVHGRTPQGTAPVLSKGAPTLVAPLDIQITLPGQTFVRGHGLDSEWRGGLKVGGTSAAPAISGSLESVRGTFDILGKTFRVTRGVIAFDGGAKFDPRLDIAAEVAASDITAQALIGGVASAPTVTLSSTPVVPQDEILARVLFGSGLGQISAGEGLQVAQAAATLAGGGPGVMDKLRSGLGLDRLGFGTATAGPTAGNLNPAAGGTATGSAAVSGGKYVTKGVFVGATQGTTPETSKVTVEIDVYPHVTVETDRSQAGGTGVGLNYKYDY